MSQQGGECDILCAANKQYVDSNGSCKACMQRTCAYNERAVQCTPHSSFRCELCPPLDAEIINNRSYSRVYQAGVTVNCDNWVYTPPCPQNHTSTQLSRGGVCERCPTYSYTVNDASEEGQCRCHEGNFSRVNGTCVGGVMYPMFVPNRCGIGRYNQGGQSSCVLCAIPPCPICGVGSVSSAACDCTPCSKPNMATFTSPGLFLGVTTSCEWQCQVGFYESSSASFANRCIQCAIPSNATAQTNGAATDLPLSCEWECNPGLRQVGYQCVV